MKERNVTLSDKELAHIIYALLEHEYALLSDEEDLGSSTDDAMFVGYLMERLQKLDGPS